MHPLSPPSSRSYRRQPTRSYAAALAMHGGESLDDFFTRVAAPSAALVLGPGAEPLPARFEGIAEATLARTEQAES